MKRTGTIVPVMFLGTCRNTVHGSSASPRTVLLDRKFKSLSVCPELCRRALSELRHSLTREKDAGIGTLAGTSLGGVIGSATGHAGAGAGIGAAVGLIGGALIGDQVQERQKQEQELQKQMAEQQAELDRVAQELQQLKQQQQAH